MPRKNPHGDVILADPEVIRLVAEPTRYALLVQLQRHDGATAAELARRLGLSATDVEAHLRLLADHGLVTLDGDVWEAFGRGLLVESPSGEEGEEAVRLLGTRMFLEAAAQPEPWWTADEPHLPPEWRRVAGLINARLWLTTAELQTLNDRIEELTAPYATRSERDAPEGARRVRVQCYFMPEAD